MRWVRGRVEVGLRVKGRFEVRFGVGLGLGSGAGLEPAALTPCKRPDAAHPA